MIGTRRERSRPAAAAAILLAITSLAGCGDDGESRTADPTTEVAPSSAPPTTTATPPEPAIAEEPAGAIVVAHRGASAHAPEHTLAAFDLALEQGADHIEQDLQMTADGVLVVLHDDTLDRTARGPAGSCTGPVADKTLAQLQECDFGSWFNEANPDRADPGFAGLRIPTMEAVLDRYGTDARYYIEIKAPGADSGMAEALLDLLDDAGLGSPPAGSRRVLIQSFSPESLRNLHSLRPALPLVQLLAPTTTPIAEATLDEIGEYATAIGPSFVNVDAALVDAAHVRCLDVHPYTVDEPAVMTALLDLGVDGMFTNTPDVLLAQRDEHPGPPDHCQPDTDAEIHPGSG